MDDKMTTMVFDVEADNLLEEASKVHCISIAIDGDKPKCYSGDGIDKALKILQYADKLVGHNILGYDLPLLHKLYRWKSKCKDVMDTLVLARMAWPDIINNDMKEQKMPKKYYGRHSLRSWGYRLDMHKGDIADFRTFTPEMVEYCNNDVAVTELLWSKIRERGVSIEAAKLELKFAKLGHRMHWHGIYFDEVAAAKLYVKMDDERQQLLAKCNNLVPPKVEEMRTPQYWVCPETDTQYARKSDAPPSVKGTLERGPMKQKVTDFNPMSRQQVGELQRATRLGSSSHTTTGYIPA